MAQPQTPVSRSRLEVVGPQDAEERVPAGQPFQLSIFNQFIAAAMSGNMPGNIKSTQPLFPSDGMQRLSAKYSEWAPAPYSTLPGPQSGFGPVGVESPPPIIRIMHVMSGLDDIFSMALNLDTLERSFFCMNQKIWNGLAPVSEARWRAKALDEKVNIEEAMALIQLVVDVFNRMKQPEIQGKMRSIHNKVWTEIDVFQDALKALATSKDEPAPAFSLTNLWEEFIRCHFQHMETQARSWVFKRLKVLHDTWKNELLTKFTSGRQINATQQIGIIDHWALLILNKLLDLYVEADACVHPRQDAYISKTGRQMHPEFAARIAGPDTELNRLYDEVETTRMRVFREYLNSAIEERVVDRRNFQNPPDPPFMAPMNNIVDREWAHKTIQPEAWDPITPNVENWVHDLADSEVESFGFVIYRMVYGETDAAWSAFLTKLEAGLDSGWNGVAGAEKIKSKAKLHWIDNGDGEGVYDPGSIRTHFKTFIESPDFPSNCTKSFCLAVTPASYESFAKSRPGDRKGDYRGFVVVVDPSFDPTKPSEQRRSTPGYYGSFNIIDQLVWTDLYAMGVKLGCQTTREFWSLSMEHPWGVYVGPTTGVRRREWRKLTAGIQGLAWAYQHRMASERVFD